MTKQLDTGITMSEDRQRLLDIYYYMVAARRLDELEENYSLRGIAPFQVSGTGHESSAALAPFLIADDWLHLHYRDKALMLARGMSVEDFLNALLSNANSCSKGRQMSAHVSDKSNNIVSMVCPVGNNALHSVGIASEIKASDTNPLVVCSMGEGTTQQGEVFEAIAESIRSADPVLYFIEDNGYAISTSTVGKTFYSTPSGELDEFCGAPITRINGWDIVEAVEKIDRVISEMREQRKPQIIVFYVKRLSSHTSADSQKIYKPLDVIEQEKDKHDPIKNLRLTLIDSGLEIDVLAIEEKVTAEIHQASQNALAGRSPELVTDSAKRNVGDIDVRTKSSGALSEGEVGTMRESLNDVLRYQLNNNSRVFLYGEDIEDPKGDVFGVTKGLSTDFPSRVVNSPLTESTIIGSCIGKALAGARPVAFMQFADFMHLAFNQIASELATMHWRTDGEWQCPVIIMVSCGAYRPGIGNFHAGAFESIYANIPGLDVMMPSTAVDATELLTAAFESLRPTLFFYPKSLLNITTPPQHLERFLGYGKARQLAQGDAVTVVSWGSTVPMCDEVVKSFASKGIECDFFDLRMVSPWDESSIIKSVSKTKKLLVCHEDSLNCGMGAEVIATVSEAIKEPIRVKRIARPDSFVPYNYENQLEFLPSFEDMVAAVVDLLDGSFKWVNKEVIADDIDGSILYAIGTGPSDDTVTVLEYFVKEGDAFKEGDPLVLVEANKAATDICANESGIVLQLLVDTDEIVKVGEPLISYTADDQEGHHQRLINKPPLAPREFEVSIKSKVKVLETKQTLTPASANSILPSISMITKEVGTNQVSNTEIVKEISSATEARLERLTGISSRPWLDEDQSLVSMAVSAAKKLLLQSDLSLLDIDKLIVATGTAEAVIPSLSSAILVNLVDEFGEMKGGAFDINAACSGYIYALENAYHYLLSHPEQRVLVISAEVFSDKLDPTDGGTYPYFSDIATATLISGGATRDLPKATLTDCVIDSTPDSGGAIALPLSGKGNLVMHGEEVFPVSMKSMLSALEQVCKQQNMSLSDLDLLVPHQSSQKVINVLGKELEEYNIPVYSNIAHYGNSSSSTIPLALAEVFEEVGSGKTIGLCTFGGGFTFGAAIIKT
jgi:2-oxoisovalerate dehydrogenase E1 component